ncbi:MAG: MMPL family transporter [Bacteroidia bacterium]|nr:MMPL family transporter [Bacteroidia bacterium]
MRFTLIQRRFIFAAVAIISVLQAGWITDLRFNYDVESFFPRQDPDLTFYEEVKATFAEEGNFVTIGIDHENSIFQGDFLPRLDSLTMQLGRLAPVVEVSSPTNAENHIFYFLGKRKAPFLHPHEPDRYAADSSLLWSYPDIRVKFVSADASAICLYLEITPDMPLDVRNAFVAEMKNLLQANGFEKTYFYGDIIARDGNIKGLQEEMKLLSGLALLLILIVLLLTFRSFWGVALPIIVVSLTVLWTLGSMAAFGATINLMTVLIPTIVSIVALSDVIHIMARFKDRPLALSKQASIALTMKQVGKVILLTSATTAFGFVTLSFSNIQPFIEFGIFTALGVAYAWLLAAFFLPVLLLIFPEVKPVNTGKGGKLLGILVHSLFPFIARWPWSILAVALLAALLSCWGVSQVRINANLYEDISSGDSFSETLHFFERHFLGIRSVELHVGLADSTHNFLEDEVLAEFDSLHQYLAQVYGVNDIFDLTSIMKRSNRAMNQGNPAFFVLPADSNQSAFIKLKLFTEYENLGIRSILTEDMKQARVTGRTTDVGSYEILRRNEALIAFVDQHKAHWQIRPRLTGVTLLLDKSNEIISYKLMFGLLTAIGVVSLVMGLMYRSLRMTLIAMVPNLLPLLMMLGIIGWLDIGMKMSTAIIFTIAFGIAVDDTIHMMSSVLAELRKGSSMQEAIMSTFATTGQAIVVTSVILICGFGILLFSSFHSSYLTGLLISITLLLALFADLLVLPALLLLTKKGE